MRRTSRASGCDARTRRDGALFARFRDFDPARRPIPGVGRPAADTAGGGGGRSALEVSAVPSAEVRGGLVRRLEERAERRTGIGPFPNVVVHQEELLEI